MVTPEKKEYMRQWRQLHPDKVAAANANYRQSHPSYQRDWKAAHPNYQQQYRQAKPDYRKLWYIRYKNRDVKLQCKPKQLLSSLLSHKYHRSSWLTPPASEYAEF